MVDETIGRLSDEEYARSRRAFNTDLPANNQQMIKAYKGVDGYCPADG